MRFSIWLGIGVLALPTVALARPVSYPEGITLQTWNDGERHTAVAHYSPTAKYSVGLRSEYHHRDNWWMNGVQATYLAKRWNMPSSQANVYLMGMVGDAYSDAGATDGTHELATSGGIMADWETRRWFTSYALHGTYAGDIHSGIEQRARVGVAPYIGDYGDLHTWLMLQVDHRPARSEEVWDVTPMVRLFKGVHMAEAGVSLRGDVMVNYTIRF